jgi:phosphoglycolate phosphatase-like HAD superfamily hydrolase
VTLRATLFDMDGLLLDSEVLWHKAEIEIFGSLGVPIDETMGRSTKGMFVNEVVEHWYSRYPWSGPSLTFCSTEWVIWWSQKGVSCPAHCARSS